MHSIYLYKQKEIPGTNYRYREKREKSDKKIYI